MATLSLKISVVEYNVVKTMQFDPSTIVFDACKIIRDKIPDANAAQPSDCGLFLADDDPKKGVWLESGRTLEYYLLRNGDLLEYKRKQRILRVKLLDDSVKTLQVDDSHTVAQLMITICSRIGITNHDEYSLVQDLTDEEREKTLTLKRGQSIAKDQKKLDEMKRKLHTDDELNWLDHSKTLREQGIDANETLVLRRKFFFSDQNVDARDPVQLSLLYVQTRDAIIIGAHPVTQEEAIQFGGIQCQIQFGDHSEQKHKAGFLDLKEFLPKEYLKVKGVEKKIYAEHKKLGGQSEIEAKVKYTQLARSLKTYGITFFLVKEKMKGKNKLVPMLLGITKESVVRLDAKSKEIKHTWALERVRRWAASPNSFTLDFGDYSDSYYSVQTTEGEQISQLIAGYIDIILKKRKAKDHIGIEGDEESTMYEDSVSPAKATIIQHQSSKVEHANVGSVALPAVLRAGGGGQSQFTTGSMQRAQFTQVSNQAHNAHIAGRAGQNAQLHGLTQAQRALVGTIDSSLSAVSDADGQLQGKADLPDLGTDVASQKWRREQQDISKQKMAAQLSAMNAATAQVVTLTSNESDETDYAAVGSAVATISSNIGEFSRDVRLLAALQEEESDGDRLLDAARKLASAFTNLLKAAQPGTAEPRQNLLSAASRIGEASHDIMKQVGEEGEMDTSFQDILLSLAKAVANATAGLVLKAKAVASQCDNQALQNKVIGSATQCALATSQLVACTKVVAPTISNPACQEQLVDAAKLVAKSVDSVVGTAQGACQDDKALQGVKEAATSVTKALNDLLQHIKRGVPIEKHQTIDGRDAVDTILTATDRLFGSMGDTPEMVRQAKLLAQATSQLVNALKGQAEAHPDSEMQRKLLAAAKMLADATARMVEAAKGCASNPEDAEHHQSLRQAAEDVRSATTTAAAPTLKKKTLKKLEGAARNAAAAATQLINASQAATKHNTNTTSQTQLMHQCKHVADNVIPKLVQGIKGTMNNPDSVQHQLALISAAQEMISCCADSQHEPGGKLVSAAKAAAPTVTDQAIQMSVQNAAKTLAAALAELRASASKAQEVCGSQELEGAVDQLTNLQRELQDMRREVQTGQLRPLPGDTAEKCSQQLGAISKMVGSSMAQLLTAAAQGNENYTGSAARDTASALKVLTQAVRGVAATTSDPQLQNNLIECAQDVIDKSANLIEESRKALQNPNHPDNQTRLAQVAKAVSMALNNCVNSMPGLRQVDQTVKQIDHISHRLTNPMYPSTERSFAEVQIKLNNAAESLNRAAGDVVHASRQTPQMVAQTTSQFGHSYEEFVESGLTFAGKTKDTESQTQVVQGLRSVSMYSSKLLMSTKSMLADPNAPNAKNQLAQAARAVTESINSLINVCTTSAPGQRECDNALRQIQSARPMLESPYEPVSDASYFDCHENVIERMRALGEAMTGITKHAKDGDLDNFCESVSAFANSVCGLAENAAQSAYLVGIADSASEPGRPGLVDQSQFSRANQAIQMACSNLTNPSASQQQVLSAATIVAKHTSSLCNTCRVASAKTNNPVAKRHFVQSAKDVANSTANLVKAIKALDNDFSDSNRRMCAEAAKPLIQAVESLTTYASSPEFASVPAKISMKAKSAQEPITSAGLQLIDGACQMLQAAKQLPVKPKDPGTYQAYSAQSKVVSDGIKKLLSNVKDRAPGQRECDVAIDRINGALRTLDQASLNAVSQNLTPMDDNSMQGYQEQMQGSAHQILELIDEIRAAAKTEPEKLAHLVLTLASYLEPLSNAAVGCASKTLNSKRQMSLLDQSKTVTESALQFIYAAKESAGNSKAIEAHKEIDEAADGMRDTLKDLMNTMDESASAAGVVTSMVDDLARSLAMTDECVETAEDLTFVDYQTSLVSLAKQIARHAQDIVACSGNDVGQLGNVAKRLTTDYRNPSRSKNGA